MRSLEELSTTRLHALAPARLALAHRGPLKTFAFWFQRRPLGSLRDPFQQVSWKLRLLDLVRSLVLTWEASNDGLGWEVGRSTHGEEPTHYCVRGI